MVPRNGRESGVLLGVRVPKSYPVRPFIFSLHDEWDPLSRELDIKTPVVGPGDRQTSECWVRNNSVEMTFRLSVTRNTPTTL